MSREEVSGIQAYCGQRVGRWGEECGGDLLPFVNDSVRCVGSCVSYRGIVGQKNLASMLDFGMVRRIERHSVRGRACEAGPGGDHYDIVDIHIYSVSRRG